MQSTNNKLSWADNLRAFATVMVILLHVAAPILYKYGSVSNFDWWTGNIVDGFARICVPIFLMLTGALTLPKTYQLGEFLKKRFSRILLPFIFWSLVYIMYSLFVKWEIGIRMSASDVIDFILTQFQNGAAYHLWYIYLIIGIYLFIPIISKWIVNSTKNEIIYFVVIWVVVIIINLPFLVNFIPAINFSYFAGYLGYPILGYLLTITFNNRKIKLISLIVFIVATLITIVGTYFLTKSAGRVDQAFYAYLSPNVIAAAAAIFLFFRHSGTKQTFMQKPAKYISRYSYGIYLSHVFILLLLARMGISWSLLNPVVGIPVTTLLCLTLSVLLTFALNKIPFGTYISG